MKLAFRFATILLVLGAVLTGAQESPKYLHISTNPSYAEAYVGSMRARIASNPDVDLPGFIKVPAGESSILVTIFKPGYKDTSIAVTLSQADTSYLIVSLTPSYDDEHLQYQQKALMHRSRRNIGHKLIAISAVPLIASGITALIASNEIDEANSKKDIIEKSLIREGKEYEANQESFKDHRKKANTSRNIAIGTLVAGGIFLGCGIVLSF